VEGRPSIAEADALDPSRSSVPNFAVLNLETWYGAVACLRGDNETTRLHHAARWHGGDMATRRAMREVRTAADNRHALARQQ